MSNPFFAAETPKDPPKQHSRRPSNPFLEELVTAEKAPLTVPQKRESFSESNPFAFELSEGKGNEKGFKDFSYYSDKRDEDELTTGSSQRVFNQQPESSNQNVSLETHLQNVIKRFPEFCISETEFNPFKYWKGTNEWLKPAKKTVEAAIDRIVREKSLSFNNVTALFSVIVDRFNNSIIRLKDLKGNLQWSSDLLMNAQVCKDNTKMIDKLSRIHSKVLESKKVLELLDKIEHLLRVPEYLKVYEENKQYLHAVQLLKDALELLVLPPRLCDIRGLRQLHNNLLEKKQSIWQTLVDELHNHIYMQDLELRELVTNNLGSPKTPSELRQEAHINHRMRRRITSYRSRQRRRRLRGEQAIEKVIFPSYKTLTSDRKQSVVPNEDQNKIFSELCTYETSESYLEAPGADSRMFVRVLVASLYSLGRHMEAKGQFLSTLGANFDLLIEKVLETTKKALAAKEEQEQSFNAREQSGFARSHELKLRRRTSSVTVRVAPTNDAEKLVIALQQIMSTVCLILTNHESCLETFSEFRGKRDKLVNVMVQEVQHEKKRSVYSIESVWIAIQKQMIKFLEQFLYPLQIPKSGPSLLSLSAVINKDNDPPRFTFSFSGSRKPSLVKQHPDYEGADKHVQKRTKVAPAVVEEVVKSEERWITSSVYHITSIYPLIIDFCDQVERRLEFKVIENDPASLRRFIKEFIPNVFLPKVEKDTHQKYSRILRVEESLKLPFREMFQTVTVGDKNVKILRSAVAIRELISNLFKDFRDLPGYDVQRFESILDKVVMVTHSAMKQMIDRVLTHSKHHHGALTLLKVTSVSTHLSLEENAQRYRQRNLASYLPEPINPADNTTNLKEDFLDTLMTSVMGLKKQVFIPINHYPDVAVTSTTLDWLREEIEKEIDGADRDVRSSFRGLKQVKTREFPEYFVNSPRRGMDDLEIKKSRHIEQPTLKGSTNLEMKRSSERCLFALRLDLYLRVLSKLLLIRKRKHRLSRPPQGPDSSVLQLNNMLVNIKTQISDVGGPYLIRYLFEGLADFIQDAMLAVLTRPSASYRLRINRYEADQQLCNISSMERNIFNLCPATKKAKVIPNQEALPFSRIRMFLELTQRPEQDVLAILDGTHQHIPKPDFTNVQDKTLRRHAIESARSQRLIHGEGSSAPSTPYYQTPTGSPRAYKSEEDEIFELP